MKIFKVLLAMCIVFGLIFGCASNSLNQSKPVTTPQWLDQDKVWCPPVAKVVEKAPAPAPIPPPVVEKKIEVIPFYFGFDKSNLENQQIAIDKATAAMKADPSKKAELQGNCDYKGSEAYNMKLGDRRAKTVKSILVKNGVDEKKITTKSFGESKAKGKTEAERKLDRRVDIVLK